MVVDEIFQMKKLKSFYEDVITFDRFIEVRILDYESGYMRSRFVENYQDLKRVFEEHSSAQYNVYVIINPKHRMGRKDVDCSCRRVFYMDIEHKGEKPPLSDPHYYRALVDTAKHLITGMKRRDGLVPCALVTSGRGMHLYYRIEPIGATEFKQQFRAWYKETQSALDETKPHPHIKFTDSVYNTGRLASAPGTRHTKYDEAPMREIVWYRFDAANDMRPILEKQKVYKPRRPTGHRKAKKYTEETILDSPEYRLLADYDDLPEGEIHTKVIFALKLLMHANGLTNQDEMREALEELGYANKDMRMPPDSEYEYHTRILTSWLVDNYRWCVKKGYKLPYKYDIPGVCKGSVQFSNTKLDLPWHKMVPQPKLDTFKDVVKFSQTINDATAENHGQFIRFFPQFLWEALKGCGLEPYLEAFIVQNGLWSQLKRVLPRK